jgi:trans-2,3-dihydro-3-hydroxyanthranilate isomerase
MPSLRYVVADVFTDTPLQGNQLAVFTDARQVDTSDMQAIALEMGFSETVFVLPAEQGGHARMRIFNPRSEMRFAGHPTLGTAFVLGAPLQLGVIALETGVGIVEVALERDDSGRIVFGRMIQPLPEVRPVAETAAIFGALGVSGSTLPVQLYDNGTTHILVALESEDAVVALEPDIPAIAALGVTGVSCFAGEGNRWKTRMFWPGGEDAATGSAAGPLAVHLSRHGLVAWGEWIEISQGVEIGRPSTLHARADAQDGELTQVSVGGSAVVVARGELRF